MQAYADDVCFCPYSILDSLQPTLQLLLSLGLTRPKCKVLVTGMLKPEQITDHLQRKNSFVQ
eukprot:5389591-Pyramimonas_sp.AAC.1